MFISIWKILPHYPFQWVKLYKYIYFNKSPVVSFPIFPRFTFSSFHCVTRLAEAFLPCHSSDNTNVYISVRVKQVRFLSVEKLSNKMRSTQRALIFYWKKAFPPQTDLLSPLYFVAQQSVVGGDGEPGTLRGGWGGRVFYHWTCLESPVQGANKKIKC